MKDKNITEILAQLDTYGTRALLQDVALMKCRAALQRVLDNDKDPFGLDILTKEAAKEALLFSRWVIE